MVKVSVSERYKLHVVNSIMIGMRKFRYSFDIRDIIYVISQFHIVWHFYIPRYDHALYISFVVPMSIPHLTCICNCISDYLNFHSYVLLYNER